MDVNILKRLAKMLRMKLILAFKYKVKSAGKGFYVGRRVHIRKECLEAQDYVFIGSKCRIASRTKLGNFVMLASGVSLVGGDHRMDRRGVPMIFSGRGVNRPIIVEDDVWVGHGTVIMHGVTIGEGAIVAAGSIVTHNVNPYTIVGGNPAKEIRRRFSSEVEKEEHRAKLKTYREDRKLWFHPYEIE
ncbi:acyltransferase [Desulfospira joergensenii]|uniref:acyltransferase n=1 Tax=Desulfospira joergensenii TaxID=53329 RepID=UPI0003B40F73|nr:CatB-related O-acetyltransferase [Desulfospira joergensenii]